MKLTTTLNKIRLCGPCGIKPGKDGSVTGWLKLLSGLPEDISHDTEIDFEEIMRINGLADTTWCFRSAPEHHKIWARFAIFSTWQVQHLTRNKRSHDDLISAWQFLKGGLSKENMLRDAAYADSAANAYAADYAAYAADSAAAYAADSAADSATYAYAADYAAYAADYAANSAAAYAADRAAAAYAYAAAYAAYAYAYGAAYAADEKKSQERVLLLVLQDPENHEKILLDNMPGFEKELNK